jgi:hypothetical protein
LLFTLWEYPVREVLALYALYHRAGPELVEPEFYSLCPDIEERLDIPMPCAFPPPWGGFRGWRHSRRCTGWAIGAGRLRPIWHRPVWNWRRGIWPDTGGSGLG